MSPTVRVYVNGRGVDAPSGGGALDAVRLADPALAERIASGERVVTDSRGLPVPNDSALYNGAIFRTAANRATANRADAASGAAEGERSTAEEE